MFFCGFFIFSFETFAVRLKFKLWISFRKMVYFYHIMFQLNSFVSIQALFIRTLTDSLSMKWVKIFLWLKVTHKWRHRSISPHSFVMARNMNFHFRCFTCDLCSKFPFYTNQLKWIKLKTISTKNGWFTSGSGPLLLQAIKILITDPFSQTYSQHWTWRCVCHFVNRYGHL